MNDGNAPPGLAGTQQAGVAALVRLAASAATVPMPVVRPPAAPLPAAGSEFRACLRCGQDLSALESPGRPRRQRHRRRSRIAAIVIAPVALISAAVLSVLLLSPGLTAPSLAAPAGATAYAWPHRAPVGITLSGLQDYVITPNLVHTMERQIRASRIAWHSNTVRLQILQDRLVGVFGTKHDRYYMYVIRTLADYAIHLGLNVVLNAQTELSVGYNRGERLPTHTTWKFWQYILQAFQDNPHVILDLFNEPRHCTWAQWDTGAVMGGVRYEGMQQLVSQIRATDADNSIWVEGINWATTLEGVPLLRQPSGFPPIVYTIHHPGSTTENAAPANLALWWQSFGYLAARHIPVVDAEFANYIGNYHWKNAAAMIPRYFRYLTAHHVGLMAWSLVPGALNSTDNYTSASDLPQGDGHLVKRFFGLTSRYYSHHGRKRHRKPGVREAGIR